MLALPPRLQKIGLHRVATVLIVASAALIRIVRVHSEGLWYDEILSVDLARMSWPGMFEQLIVDDVHPPLYFVLLKLNCAVLGTSELGARVPSLLFSILTVWGALRLGRTLKRLDLGYVVALFLTFSPMAIRYATEVRPYPLLLLLGVLALDADATWRADPSSRRARWYWLLVHCGLVLTHYFGVIFFAVASLLQLASSRGKELRGRLMAGAMVGAVFLLWVPLLYVQTKGHPLTHLASDIPVRWLIYSFSLHPNALAHGGLSYGALEAYLLLALFFVGLLRPFRRYTLIPLLGFGLALAISHWRPLGESRNLIVFLPAYALSIGAAILGPGGRLRSPIGAVAILVLGLVALPDAGDYRPRVDFRGMAAVIRQVDAPTGPRAARPRPRVIVSITDEAMRSIRFYMPKQTHRRATSLQDVQALVAEGRPMVMVWHSFGLREEQQVIPKMIDWVQATGLRHRLYRGRFVDALFLEPTAPASQ